MRHIDDIIRYENDEMTDDEVIEFFQRLVDDGTINILQGAYQRMAYALIEGGYVTRREQPQKRKAHGYGTTGSIIS